MKTIEDTGDEYLNTIQDTTTTTEHEQHRAAITNFIIWLGDTCTTTDDITEQQIGRYAQKLRDIDNVVGDTYTTAKTAITNFYAYAKQHDPEVTALRISEEQVWAKMNLTDTELRNPPDDPAPHEHPWREENDKHRAIREVREYLDEYAHGELPHAYFELLVASANSKHRIVEVTINDIDTHDRTARIPIDMTDDNRREWIVDRANLISKHTITLTAYTANVLRKYIQDHRVEPGDGSDAFFTRENGRVSEDELNVLITDVVTEAGEHARQTTEESHIETYVEGNNPPLNTTYIARAAAVTTRTDYPNNVYRW